MKNNNLTTGLFAALLLSIPMLGLAAQSQESFEPKVIYQDPELIAKHAARAAEAPAVPASAAKQEVASTRSETSVANKKEESSMESNYLVGVIALALAGFVFWANRGQGSQRPQGTTAPVAPASTGEAQGETGVARYLKRLEGAASSTVAAAAAVAAETGVARYLKTVETSAKETVAQAQTGVARYLANRDKT